MKIAYLAPEIPALSATFVYNEILQLEELGTEVISFSVHKPNSNIQEERVSALETRTVNLYAESKWLVLKSHLILLTVHSVRYFKTLWLLCKDMWHVKPFSRTAFGLGYRFFFSASLAVQLIEEECDHLHVHFAHIPTDIAMYASVLSAIPFSVTAHANDIFERGWLLVEKVNRAKFFATISDFNKRHLLNIGANLEKVKIIRCGVDPTKFSQKNNSLRSTVVKIGVIGRLVEKKGIDLLVNAVAILKQQRLLVKLFIAGNGPIQEKLVNLTNNLGLSESDVQFLNAIPHAEVPDFIRSLDIFILPCREDEKGDIDGIPVVLMEAMLSGVPVVTTELSGIPELVVNKETGILIEQNNTEELVRAILSLINDDVMRSKLVDKAIVKVREGFSLIENTKKLKALFINNS